MATTTIPIMGEPAIRWAVMALLAVLLAVLHARVLLPRLPEPATPATTDDCFVKPTYASLPTQRFVAVTALVAAVTQVVTITAPPQTRWAWLVMGSSVLVLVAVDWRTTYLPRRLTWAGMAQLALALVIGALLAGRPLVLVWALAGSLGMAGFLAIVWALTKGGIGFGDVRLAFVLGALAGAHGWGFWWLSLFAGALLGVAAGLVHTWWRRSHPSTLGKAYAYGPAWWAGLYVAFAVITVGRWPG